MAKEKTKPVKEQEINTAVEEQSKSAIIYDENGKRDLKKMREEYLNSPEAQEIMHGEYTHRKEDKGMSYDVKFSSFPSEGSVKGVCSITFGGEIAVKGVKVIEGSKGLFVAMPSYKAGDEYRDIVYPITKEGRQKLNEAVIGEYNNQVQAHQAAVNQNNGVEFDPAAMEEFVNPQAPTMQ